MGVDVFFVVSGYLITSRLIDTIEKDRFSLSYFYQRRIARLAPAALAVIASTLVVSAFVYSSQDFAALGSSSVAAATGTINFKLVLQGNYFDLSPDAQPLIHYWSLAVEEQFYLLFPIFLYSILKTRRRPLLVLAIFCAASFVAWIAMIAWAPTAAFYLLPARAWELLAGSIVAAVERFGPAAPDTNAPILSGAGVIVILLGFFLEPGEGFLELTRLGPVVGSTAVLSIIDRGRSVFLRFLAHPALVFIGRRSYSLYLCHLPVFSIIGYSLFLTNPSAVVALKILVTVVASLLCYHFVERPMRLRWGAPGRSRMAFITTVLGVTLIGVAGFSIRAHYYPTATAENVAKGGVLINPHGNRRVALIGDSKASAHGYQLAQLARKLDFRLNILSVVGANELPGEPHSLWAEVSGFLTTNRPEAVIVAASWSSKLERERPFSFEDSFALLLEKTGCIVVVTEPPEPPSNATRQGMLSGARSPFVEDPETRRRRLRATAAIRAVDSDRLRVLELDEIFLHADGAIRMVAEDGRLTYQDRRHLSDAGSARVLPAFEQMLRGCFDVSH